MDNPIAPTRLGDHVELQRGNTYQSSLLGQPGPVLLGLASITRNGGFRSDNLKTYGGHSDARMLLDPGDIYVSLKDVTQSADLLGAVSRVPGDIFQGRLTQDTVKLIFKTETAPKDYIYWCLRTPQYREYCRAHATGTTNLGLPREDFLSFQIPALTSTRESLVALLQALDDKIELNRRMNETLEATARAIFTDWFIDFGPTRAKMEGGASYLEPDLWSKFPDHLDEVGLPKGWAGGVLLDLCELKRGYDLPTAQRLPGRFPIVSSSGISGTHASSMAKGPGVVTGRYGTIGEVHYIEDDFWPLNTSLYVSDFKGAEPRFVYHVLSGLDFAAYSDKGAVPGINRNHLHEHPVTIAPKAIQKQFAELLSSNWERQRLNRDEVQTLSATRDLLLPRLMSGEIRMTAAEKAMEAAV